jgi:Asp-tRNA(Asn)/Glu-tRNA(Gln) amidotransferase A subunit family amidase
VATGFCEIALGTQTIGSINRPAAFCGVIGFKPSYDRISRAGVIPLSPSVDHVGVFASAVETVSRAAAVLILDWAPIPHSLPSNPVCAVPVGSYLDRAEVEGLEHFWATVTRLERAGVTVRRIPAMTDFETIYQRHNLIVAYDAARVHEKWFAEFGTLYHAKTVELIQRGQQIREPEYIHALEGRAQLRQELTNLMEAEGIEVWLSPPAPGPAPRGLASTGNPVMNLPWTHAGFPTLTLPAGTHQDGLPMGIQLAAGWYGDEKLLAWAQILNASLSHDEST